MKKQLDVANWTEVGYQPLVYDDNWQVALLNWEPAIDLQNIGEIERHINTDEVFILWRGQSALFVSGANGLQVEDMQAGVIYNVKRGSWHNLVSTQDASIIIVEKRDTHLTDTEIRRMTEIEIFQPRKNLPAWVENR